MSNEPSFSGPQFRGDRPVEQEAVRTTIVGGRPPGSGKGLGPIPRGLEVLVKKASVDPEFRQLLLTERGNAAQRIGLDLDPAESIMLGAVPAEQLEAIIARTTVPDEHRRAFLGHAAAAMLAAMGLVMPGCGHAEPPVSDGIRPDRPPPTKGIAPDRPPGSERPERIEPTKGDRADVPPGAEKSKAPLDPSGETAKPQAGNVPEKPETPTPGPFRENPLRSEEVPPTQGIRPDRPQPDTGIRPDEPPPPIRGTRPDRPPATERD